MRRTAQVAENPVDDFDLVWMIGVGHVDNVQDQVRFGHLFERCTKSRHQLVWEFTNKTHSVGDQNFGSRTEAYTADDSIQSGKNAIRNKRVLPGQPLKQGRLSGIGISNKGDGRQMASFSLGAVQLAMFSDLLDFLLQFGDPGPDSASIDFQLRLARATCSDAPTQPGQQFAAAREMGNAIAQLGQLYL